MQLNYATKEEFLQKFLDSVDLKHIKPKKPHNNYVDMQDECLKDAKCIICTKATQSDVLVNFVFTKEFSGSIYNVVEGSHKAAVENSMSGFGEVTWFNNEGKNPYIQVRKSLDDFSKEEEIFAWYKDAVFAFYACVPLEGKSAECTVSATPKVTQKAEAQEKIVVQEKPEKVAAPQSIDLDKLIEAALADGVVTEKERAVLIKKATAAGIDADEFELLLDGKIYESNKNSVANNSKNSESNNVDGHDYVDLGLPSRLMWATCNIGAEKPENFGQYFKFGETVPYVFEQSHGDIQHDLRKDQDAASVIWGGRWKMPTIENFRELIENCEWEETEVGLLGKSKKNSNTILFPYAGEKNKNAGGNSEYRGMRGCYRSTNYYRRRFELLQHDKRKAPEYVWHYYGQEFAFKKGEPISFQCINPEYNQYDGDSVRPVIELE